MTSPNEVINEFSTKPFELYFLRGKQFTILENLPRTKDIREIEEINKWNKKASAYFIAIEQGLFQKDLKLTKPELEALFLAIPKTIENFRGSMLEVSREDAKTFKYMGATTQDTNGNRLDGSVPIGTHPTIQAPQDQKTVFLNKLIVSMTTLEALGNKIDTSVLMKICENMSPGNALELIKAAKDAGIIYEKDGSYKVVS